MEESLGRLVAIPFMIYGLLLMIGSGPKEFANPFAKWLWKKMIALVRWLFYLPFVLIGALLFKKATKKKKKKKK